MKIGIESKQTGHYKNKKWLGKYQQYSQEDLKDLILFYFHLKNQLLDHISQTT